MTEIEPDTTTTDIEPATPTTTPTAELTAWDILERQAHTLATSSIVPRQYRHQPGDIIAAGLMGQELGWPIMTSLRFISVVEGRPELAAEGMVALIRKAGHSITGELSTEEVTVVGVRADNGDTMTVTWSQADANRANLTRKDNWQKYPTAMLWARAVSQLKRVLFPDVAVGVSYVHGEIGEVDLAVLGEPIVPPPVDVVDTNGRVLSATGPTVYAADDDVDELLEKCKEFDHEQRERFFTAAEEYSAAHPRSSWSFQSHHRWTRKELVDCRAVVEALLGSEPWDDEPVVITEVAKGRPSVVELQQAMVRGRWAPSALNDALVGRFPDHVVCVEIGDWDRFVVEHPDRAVWAIAHIDAVAARADEQGGDSDDG